MANYYDLQVHFCDGTVGAARGIGNNAAWVCKCGAVLLGPHVEVYAAPPCPACGKTYKLMRGTAPQFVSRIDET